MKRIVILGGYGAVGREAAEVLMDWYPGAVVVAGRNLAKAREVAGAIPVRVDLRDDADLEQALDGADAVLMCVDQDNARVARACLERGVHYVDVSASHAPLAEVEKLESATAAAVLSVGLAPGVTNLLARHCAELSGGEDVEIGVLLGAGDRHGAAAIDWTLDSLSQIGPSWQVRFPEPYGTRTVHRFPFSDQHTLPRTLGVSRARTGMCLDSRALTAALPRAARPLERPRVRAMARSALTKVHVGGDGFAVTVSSGDHTASFSGRRQSRATGLAAALVIGRLDALPPGVHHIDEVIDPAGYLTELAGHGFELDLGPYDAG